MKSFLLFGGFLGFVGVFVGGIGAGNDLSNVLCNATIGCLGVSILFRGFWHLLACMLRQADEQHATDPQPAPGEPNSK